MHNLQDINRHRSIMAGPRSVLSRSINSHAPGIFNRQRRVKPVVRMKRSAFADAMCSICSNPPETGGILLGPVEADHIITDFYFDKGANCSGSTYSPDHKSLSKKMKEEWIPNNVDMKGFVHSHPGTFDRLSNGDMAYITRLLEINEDMSIFIAPIIIPHQFRMSPYVIFRDNLKRAYKPQIIFF